MTYKIKECEEAELHKKAKDQTMAALKGEKV
jgi:hypothetical protein